MSVGTKLYHGSSERISGGFPNKATGSWFSTDKKQSIWHALAGGLHQSVLYEYEVIKPLRIKHFPSIANFNKWALNQGHNFPTGFKSFVYGSGNIKVASKMCAGPDYNGWALPSLQRQVMICRPKEFLKLVTVYKIKSNAGKNNFNFWTSPNGNVLWKPNNSVTYNIHQVKINNLENLHEPPSNRLYHYFNHKDIVFINSHGKEIARGKNAVVMTNGKPSGVRIANNKILQFKKHANFRGNISILHRHTLRERSGQLNKYFSSVLLEPK